MASGCCGRVSENYHPPPCIARCQENETVQAVCGWISRNALLVSTIVAVVMGYVVGALLRDHNLGYTALVLIGFPGELFLRMLQMLVLPLIIASLITGTTALDPKTNGRVALMTVLYFLLTSFISATIGVLLVTAIHPGHPDIKNMMSGEIEDHDVSMLDTFLDLFRNVLPENVIEACVKQVQSHYYWVERGFKIGDPTASPMTDNTTLTIPLSTVFWNETSVVSTMQTVTENVTLPTAIEPLELIRKHKLIPRSQMNALGLIVFFMAFGMILANMKERAVLLVEYFVVLDKIIMRLVKCVIWMTPLGVASLICERMASLTNLSHILEHMGLYIGTVVIGLFVHQFVLLPILYFVLVRSNPFRFWWNVFQAFLTGFATESSAAALPIAIQCMEENNKADSRITRFVLPVGATINMNGTAMFVAIASIFIAQMNAVEPTVAELITIIVTATAVSVASSATPSASLFLMVMTLSVLPKVPLSDVSLLFAIDWFLGRCRTTNNIVGDCYAVAVIQHYYGKVLDEHRSELDQNRKDHMVPGIGLMFD